MPISWNEIRSNAIIFAKEFAQETREHAEAKTFWDRFFEVFGLNRRHLASFEEPVKKISGQYGFIDLFWKGVLLAEHKSGGKDLGKATSQAFDYVQSLIRESRQDEVPRYIIISDFLHIVLHDLEANSSHQFKLSELYLNVDKLAFIPGYKQHSLAAQDPINLKAVQLMGDLHDTLEAGGYTGHELERLLVRILFCLFAEDTGIFERNTFQMYLENHTHADGSDLGAEISLLFDVLNKPVEKRQANLREELARLPYVNGELFAEFLGFPAFNRDMRNSLLGATRFDWSQISPAVFGALFQAVMEPVERRKIGAHYTSERDILKVIGPLFLDNLRSMLEKAGNDKNKLTKLHDHIASLRLLDPACGCGNFLVIAYRELRLLELEILKRLSKGQKSLDIGTLSKIDVDQMYGIEIEEWPARIAEVAMWLMDHQMNLRLSEEFGDYFVRLPLKKSPHIRHGNALTLDWNEVLPAPECSYVLGNPPFIGTRFQTTDQRAEVKKVVGASVKGVGLLDYVAAWYVKAAEFIQNTDIKVAFVSTNSITQGEQVGVLWNELIKLGIKIQFAHRTFAWQSEARGAAHVHVVIIGFCLRPIDSRRIFDYQHVKADPVEINAKTINPYLIDAADVLVSNRPKPICKVNSIGIGNQPIDDGNYLFTSQEKDEFIRKEPKSEKWFLKWYGSDEFINRSPRWCLWIGDCPPNELKEMPTVLERVQRVREFRKKSQRPSTVKIADTPTRFLVHNMPNSTYLLIPEVSSERRAYIPMGFMKPDVICSNLVKIMPNATLYDFGVLSSAIHMAWVRQVCGRLESRYRYSAKLVYNNFPWPQNPTEKQKLSVEAKAQAVLDARAKYSNSSLADLYDPLTMPLDLLKAHKQLDRSVELCYRPKPFQSDREKVEYLFELYVQLTMPLAVEKRPTRRKKNCD